MARKRGAVAAAVQRAQKDCKLCLQLPEPSADDASALRENAEYARTMLMEVGGLEIAAMAGAMMHAKEVRDAASEIDMGLRTLPNGSLYCAYNCRPLLVSPRVDRCHFRGSEVIFSLSPCAAWACNGLQLLR
jgi:hypothetical protein